MESRIVLPHGDVLNADLSLLRSAVERDGFVVEHVDPLLNHVAAIHVDSLVRESPFSRRA